MRAEGLRKKQAGSECTEGTREAVRKGITSPRRRSDLSQKISLRNRLMKKGRACEERKRRHRQRSSATV
ncbi:hypothetical protein T12_3138 [Trichinella patagoniensis]|uniref:Uncharacterized protein n=1 Tax=Trichinella patagoniensis TaxID=990121 RepID=A0A0V1A792_9BILA|nr:hypothetical protein T12_3138 [Trichinella patagoniensis]